MREEEAQIRHLLRTLSKILYVLDTELREAHSISKSLEEFKETFEKIESSVDENPGLKIFVEDFIKEEDLLPVFKEVRARFLALQELLNENSPIMDSADVFMEEFRSYRYMLIPEEETLLDLIERIFGSGDVYVRLSIVPEKFHEFVKKEGLEVLGRFTIHLTPDQLYKGVKKLLEAFPDAGLVIVDAKGTYRLTWKPDVNIVRVDAPKEKVPLVDSIGKAVGATILDA